MLRLAFELSFSLNLVFLAVLYFFRSLILGERRKLATSYEGLN